MKLKAFILFILGIVFLLYAIYAIRLRYIKLSESEIVNQDNNQAVSLSIESAGILLPISNKLKQSVIHIDSTPEPGEVGNSILYGHNWPTVLSNLHKVKKGDIVRIAYQGDKEKLFEVQNVHTVWPTNVSLLENTDKAQLTIYTCTGFLDTMRLVVIATPIIEHTSFY